MTTLHNVTEIFRKIAMLKKIILFAATLCLINLAACSPYTTWDEEVKLNDGRVIVVEQKRRMEGIFVRETILRIKLPEFSAPPIVWDEMLFPLILNVDGGKLYIVGQPPTGRETDFYNCPEHGYVGFIWDTDNAKWKRIPFNQIPERIYDSNLLFEKSVPPDGITFLSLARKNASDLNGYTGPVLIRRLDPNAGDGCRYMQRSS